MDAVGRIRRQGGRVGEVVAQRRGDADAWAVEVVGARRRRREHLADAHHRGEAHPGRLQVADQLVEGNRGTVERAEVDVGVGDGRMGLGGAVEACRRGVAALGTEVGRLACRRGVGRSAGFFGRRNARLGRLVRPAGGASAEAEDQGKDGRAWRWLHLLLDAWGSSAGRATDGFPNIAPWERRRQAATPDGRVWQGAPTRRPRGPHGGDAAGERGHAGVAVRGLRADASGRACAVSARRVGRVQRRCGAG